MFSKIKIWSLIIVCSLLTCCTKVPHRYFINDTEVNESFWRSVPDSVKSGTLLFDCDTVVIEGFSLALGYRLDSVTNAPDYLIAKISDEDLALLFQQMSALKAQRSELEIKLSVGDEAPQFDVVKNSSETLISDVISEDKCYLVNFWATWCGNCLIELDESEIPAHLRKFADTSDFVFLPVCIDSSREELKSFFDSEQGKRWKYLEAITTLDIDRKANSLFANPGSLPLNIVIGKNRIIRYIKIGRITTEEEYNDLERAIVAGLQ